MKTIWDRIDRYFSPKEAWGKSEKMSGLLLLVMYDLRFHSGWPCIIHCGTQGRHCKNSYHYQGLAVDFYFKTPNGSFTFREQAKYLQQYLVDMQLDGSVGLGIYPEWLHPGFHLDVRGKKARWLCQDGEYLPLSRFV